MYPRSGGTASSQAYPSSDQFIPPVLRSFLAGVTSDDRTLLSQFQIKRVEIGDILFDGAETAGLWLVCEGAARLVAWDPHQQREVSFEVVGVDGIFGVEGLVGRPQVVYQAIATGSAQVAYLPSHPLESLLVRSPALQQQLSQLTAHREALLFFKTQTAVGCPALSQESVLKGDTLRQWVSYLERVTIPAGTLIATLEGHCWLYRGNLTSEDPQVPPPSIGQSWGYPEATPGCWISATEVELYRLPIEHWEAATSIAPQLIAARDEKNPTADLQTQPSTHQAPVKATFRRATSLHRLPDPSPPSPATDPSHAATNVIDFPRPRRQPRHFFWQGRPFIEQQSSSDCGVACLAMIAQYWGKRYPLHQLREWAHVGRSGASLRNLATAAEAIGFHTRPVRASLNRLAPQKTPWIAHWQGDHYIVVYQVTPHFVQVADPAIGRRKLPRSEFLQHWTGYALLLEPTEAFQQAQPPKTQSLSQFGQLLFSQRGLLLQVILVSLLLQLFGLITPLFTQIILDQVVVQKSLSALHVFAIGLLMFSVWRTGLSTVRQYLLDYFSNRLDLTLMAAFIRHALRLPLKFFEDRNVGDIITRIQENTKIQRFLVRQAVSTWLDAAMAIVYLGLMFYYNWKLAWLVVGMIPPLVILTLCATPWLKHLSRSVFKEDAEQTSLVVEMMNGIAAVKGSATEQEIRWRWEERLTRMLNVQFTAQKLANGLQTVGGLINVLGSTALLWYGAMLVIQDQLTIGQFVAFNMLIGNVINPVLGVIGVWDEFQEVLISVERLNDVFSAKPEESPSEPMLILPPIRGDVRFDQVTFSYEGADDRPILQGLSFTVEPGQMIAIVGRSGSGKSTLVKLIQGLYHPSKGRVLVDGHDVRHISPASLRSQLGVVPQECFLFSGTILENIQLYRADFGLEDIIEVAKLAEAHPFIQDLPLGYQTKVGERGATLSGGQRQRIAIARALLGNPRMLILDEATSSLDTESERRFQRNLDRLSRDRTTFVIAHRLSTVQNADRILVLDRGVLVEEGTHQDLMQAQGLYFHLAQQQLNL